MDNSDVDVDVGADRALVCCETPVMLMKKNLVQIKLKNISYEVAKII